MNTHRHINARGRYLVGIQTCKLVGRIIIRLVCTSHCRQRFKLDIKGKAMKDPKRDQRINERNVYILPRRIKDTCGLDGMMSVREEMISGSLKPDDCVVRCGFNNILIILIELRSTDSAEYEV